MNGYNLIKIEKVSVCFMSQDMSVSKSQLESIDETQLSFEMVPYFSADRNKVLYSSYSQLINEVIDDTDCEFMIFLNPKALPTAQDLNLLLEKLSSGYCMAALCGFAFSGFSKQLIREIGMFDERFIAGEHEDIDMLLRLRMKGKAIWLTLDWNKQIFKKSKCPPNRGASSTYFWKKWRWTGHSAKKTDYIEKSISKRHSTHIPEISDSWMEWEKSFIEGEMWDPFISCEIDESGWKIEEEECSLSIKWSYREGYFFIEMLSDKETAISFFLTTEERIPIYKEMVYQNTWHSLNLSEKRIELRLYYEGNLIYINRIESETEDSMFFRLPGTIAKK